MRIRTRITLLFILTVTTIIVYTSLLIYFQSSNARQELFKTRLNDRLTYVSTVLPNSLNHTSLINPIFDDSLVILPYENIWWYDTNFYLTHKFGLDHSGLTNIDESFLKKLQTEKKIDFSYLAFEGAGVAKESGYLLITGNDLYGNLRLKRLKGILISSSTISIIICLVTAWFYSGQVLRPISRLIKQIQNINESTLTKPLNEGNGKDELALLAKEFNKLFDDINSSIIAQKSFVRNASHELRNPLASIISQLEVILLHTPDMTMYESTTRSVLEETKKINQVLNKLLILATLNGQSSLKYKQFIRIDDLIGEACGEFKQRPQNKLYKVVFHISTEIADPVELFIHADGALLKTAFINLIDNACKYSLDGRCLITLKREPRLIAISFVNFGRPIPEDEKDKIFEPFFRGSHKKSSDGHGIGLALVKEVVKFHQGEIRVVSKNELTNFTISFHGASKF